MTPRLRDPTGFLSSYMTRAPECSLSQNVCDPFDKVNISVQDPKAEFICISNRPYPVVCLKTSDCFLGIVVR